MASATAKLNGSYYTPSIVARTLIRWVVRKRTDRLLDPACGDGEFLALHSNSVGVEFNQSAAIAASRRTPGSVVHVEDFFVYANRTKERFDCAAGNPPFIRYQSFAGDVRRRALDYCNCHGARFSELSSSWAPFLVAAASLLKRGGRMAFVVPAEIGHARYAAPFISFLMRSFKIVHLVAIRQTVFTDLSQDVWLLYADGYGENTDHIALSVWDQFKSVLRRPNTFQRVSSKQWESWGCRLRPFLVTNGVRQLYERLRESSQTQQLGDAARVGIGYVSGANDFFHLRPSAAKSVRIPDDFLLPTVRNGRVLPTQSVNRATLARWIEQDEACLLLRLQANTILPQSVLNYLGSAEGRLAQRSYKCSHRKPWYVVPDVLIPDGFLSYMSGDGPSLVSNSAGCSCTNSVHAVRMKDGYKFSQLQAAWGHPLTRLSTELEGHPLGGGMLKLEPREASRVLLPNPSLTLSAHDLQQLREGREVLRKWRHYA